MDAQLKLTLSNLEIHTPRMVSLAGFLMQAIIMVINFSPLKTSWLMTNRFSPRSELNPKTSLAHCEPSQIGRISVHLSLWGTYST